MIFNLLVILTTISVGYYFLHLDIKRTNIDAYRKRYIKLICLILILQSGLRNVAVGADTYAYYKSFNKIDQTSWSNIFKEVTDYYTLGVGKDPGYSVFQKLIQYLIPDYQLYLLFIAILFFSVLGSFIYKNTTRISDAILAFVLYSALFYSFFSITGLRQTIATAATLYAYEFLKTRKLIPFILILLIASTIHKSVLIFIPFYFIANYFNVKMAFYSVLVLFPFVMNFKSEITSLLISVSSSDAYLPYKDYKGAGTLTFTLMILLVALVAWWRMKPILKLNDQNNLIIAAFSLALFFTPLTWVNPSLMRIVQYFSIFMLLLIPLIFRSLRPLLKNNSNLVFAFCLLLLIVLFMKSGWGTEYRFFWQDMMLGDNYR